ncbi:MAG TPA: hypothetical protein VLI06_20205 [Solimonas sp.]|nr:hypothetical protein [Solimonas sp.]
MSRRPLAAIALAAALLVACSAVTPENYARVEAGMSRDEVYAILGKPDQVNGSGIGPLTLSNETWAGRKHSIHITFGGDKVALKSIDAAGEQ